MKKFYALKNKNDEIRKISSSGGVFNAISQSIINSGGVVYGAVYDENHNVVHARIDDIDDLYKLSGSKYSRSDLGTCIQSIKDDIKKGYLVLFSGTPCQIYALKSNFKDKIPNNLITVDLVCHGTPQKKYFDDYKSIMEKKYSSKIKTINMRYKKNKKKNIITGPVVAHYMYIEFNNGKKYIEDGRWDMFYRLFDLFLPNGCFNCKFANMNRIGDITIGDFHDFNNVLNEFNDGNGVSLMIVNTEKGTDIFKKIKDDFDCLEFNFEDCKQPALVSPTKKPQNYDDFNEYYNQVGQESFKKYAKLSISEKIKYILYKVGLLDYLARMKWIIRRKK